MRLEELKKGFWGYQKDAVFQYITQQEEKFTQQLAEKNAQMEQVNQQAQARIQAVEQEKRVLQEELARLREWQDQIPQAILDARASAEMLKAETCAKEKDARETVRQAMERDLAELASYREKVADLRKAFQAAMKGLEQQVEEMEQQVEALYETAPKGNLTLFQ